MRRRSGCREEGSSGLWGVRERGEEKQNRKLLRRLAKAARESNGEATTVDDGVGGVARRQASRTHVVRRRCQNGAVSGETRGARGGVDGGAMRGQPPGQHRRAGAVTAKTER